MRGRTFIILIVVAIVLRLLGKMDNNVVQIVRESSIFVIRIDVNRGQKLAKLFIAPKSLKAILRRMNGGPTSLLLTNDTSTTMRVVATMARPS